MTTPLVSICIPAYRSGPRIGDALESALSQTVKDIEIVVSNDGGCPSPTLDAYRSHPRIRVIDQVPRLGWVENSNFVLSHATGRYFMILPHDDQIAPTYVEACLAILETEPTAFAAHSDVRTPTGIYRIREVRGDLETRVKDVFRTHLHGASFHAVMRRHPEDWPSLKMVKNPPADFLVDTVWILQQALHGELRRIDQPLFIKHVGPETTHAGWKTLAPAEIARGWLNHCDLMEGIALAHAPGMTQVARLARKRRNPRNVADSHAYMRQPFPRWRNREARTLIPKL